VSARRTALAAVTPAATTNAGLWLDKYLKNQTDDSQQGTGVGDKAELIEQACKVVSTPPGYEAHFNARQALLTGPRTLAGRAAVQGRMVVGLGNKGVLEVGVTLDHTWGVPVIPGSALKGLAAATAHQLVGGPEWSKAIDEKGQALAREPNSYDVVFGSTEDRGGVIFHDAWWVPTNRWPLELDVITVHHSGYYGAGNEAPSDFDNPNPVSFLSCTGSYLVVVEASAHLPQPIEPWLESAMVLLKQGLASLGVGAKTSSGYGLMDLSFTTAAERNEAAARDAKARSEQVSRKVAQVNAGSAAQLVPKLLADALEGDQRREVAVAIIAKLTKRWFKGREETPWVKALFEAANQSIG
jgi:CRISPR-associated protein Cmr6